MSPNQPSSMLALVKQKAWSGKEQSSTSLRRYVHQVRKTSLARKSSLFIHFTTAANLACRWMECISTRLLLCVTNGPYVNRLLTQNYTFCCGIRITAPSRNSSSGSCLIGIPADRYPVALCILLVLPTCVVPFTFHAFVLHELQILQSGVRIVPA
jgi:hypothetical protein